MYDFGVHMHDLLSNLQPYAANVLTFWFAHPLGTVGCYIGLMVVYYLRQIAHNTRANNPRKQRFNRLRDRLGLPRFGFGFVQASNSYAAKSNRTRFDPHAAIGGIRSFKPQPGVDLSDDRMVRSDIDF